jgi:hypothetical protein
VAALVLEYYVLLRSVLRAKPRLRRCLARCRHCRIFFLTHPRNAGRKDLGCPFGCRSAQRKQQSTRRSVAYYRDPVGKQKKRALNGKRTRPKADDDRPAACPPRVPVLENRDAAGWPPRMLAYVQMVVGLIEARAVSRTEILQMLQRVLRQRTMARRRKIDHAVSWLHEQPP